MDAGRRPSRTARLVSIPANAFTVNKNRHRHRLPATDSETVKARRLPSFVEYAFTGHRLVLTSPSMYCARCEFTGLQFKLRSCPDAGGSSQYIFQGLALLLGLLCWQAAFPYSRTISRWLATCRSLWRTCRSAFASSVSTSGMAHYSGLKTQGRSGFADRKTRRTAFTEGHLKRPQPARVGHGHVLREGI